jgi:hypothetical protein
VEILLGKVVQHVEHDKRNSSARTRRGWLGKVADVFRANFEGSPGEVAAACCFYVDGRPVVDL